jgi:hypothetical protein
MEAGLGLGPPMEAGFGLGGIEAGLGRGMPSGRGPREPPPPGVMPNGLLPPLRGGRPPGAAGRSPRPSPRGAEGRPSPRAPSMRGPLPRPPESRGPIPGGAGRAPAWLAGRVGAPAVPGRGGMKLGFGAPSDGGLPSRCACWAARAASCSALSAAARASAAATSMSCALAGLATGVGGTMETGAFGLPAGAAGFLGGIGLADTFGSLAVTGAGPFGALDAEGPEPAAKASLSRRATGASTVLDADLTNSPISLSLARTFLLSTPSSFASSCTRALPATALLTPRSCGRHPQRPHSCT